MNTKTLRSLYLLSYALHAPFVLVSWFFYWLSLASDWLAGVVHDHTTHRIWRVLHKRRCNELFGPKT